MDIDNTLITNPHYMLVGSKYIIIEPVYDDYNDGLQSKTNLVEVVSKNNYGFI